jgi:Major Facilitator Superfamily
MTCLGQGAAFLSRGATIPPAAPVSCTDIAAAGRSSLHRSRAVLCGSVSGRPEVLIKRRRWRVPARRLSRPRLLFLSGQTVSVFGDGLAVLAIPLLVLDLTRNPLLSGLSAASVTVGYLLVGLPAGVLVDRLDPWRVLIAMDAARALLFAALYALSAAGVLRIWALFVLALSAGACAVFFESALVVVVKDLFAVSGLMGANSALELASQISLIAGPAIVGLLATADGINLALLADALTFAVSLASLVAVTRNTPGSAGSRHPGSVRSRWGRPAGRAWPEFAASLREGLRYLLTARTLLILTAIQMVVNLCLSVEKLIIYDARETLGLSSPLIGMVVAAGGAGGLAGALGAAPLARWAGEMRLVLLAIAAAGASVACMCLASSAISLAAANLGYGAALVVAGLVNRTQRQRLVPRDLLGRVTSTVRVLFLATDPLGVVAAGAATVALGGDPRLVFLVAGVTVMMAAAGGWAGGLRAASGRPVRRNQGPA